MSAHLPEVMTRVHELLLGGDVFGAFLDGQRHADECDARRRAHAVGDGLLEAVAMADATEVGQQQVGHGVVAALERRREPEPFFVLREQRASQDSTTESVTLVGDEQTAGLAGRYRLVGGGRVAGRDEHVARLRVVPAAVAQAPDPGVRKRRRQPAVPLLHEHAGGTTTSTNRPLRSASAAAAIATSVLPEPVTASTTPRRPQLSQLTSASSCQR